MQTNKLDDRVLEAFWETVSKATTLNMEKLLCNFRRIRRKKSPERALAMHELNKSLRDLNDKLNKV